MYPTLVKSIAYIKPDQKMKQVDGIITPDGAIVGEIPIARIVWAIVLSGLDALVGKR